MNILPRRGVMKLRNSEELIETARQAVEDGYASLGEELPKGMTLSVVKISAGSRGLNAKTPGLGGGRSIVVKVNKNTEADFVYEIMTHESLHSARMVTDRFQFSTISQRIIEEGLACHFSYTHMLQTGRSTASDLPAYMLQEDMDVALDRENARLVVDNADSVKRWDSTILDGYTPYRVGFAALRLIRDFNSPIDADFFLAPVEELVDQLQLATQGTI